MNISRDLGKCGFELYLTHSRAPKSLRRDLLHVSAAQRTSLECLVQWAERESCVPGYYRAITIREIVLG